MDDFEGWYKYMLDKGYLAETANKELMRLAFDAGVDLGYYEGANFVADCEGVSSCVAKPFWCRDDA